MITVWTRPIAPSRTSLLANRLMGIERCCEPVWRIRSYFFTAWTSVRPSATVSVSGFSA